MGKIGLTEILVLLVIVLPLYFLPTIIALSRKKSNHLAIFLLNFFLGWTFVGWIVSLVWACTTDKSQTIVVNNAFPNTESQTASKSTDDKFEQLQKLKGLFDSGVLSQAEFDEQKSKILAS
jgi:hypothetical protein